VSIYTCVKAQFLHQVSALFNAAGYADYAGATLLCQLSSD
jgi:hypothetical protein